MEPLGSFSLFSQLPPEIRLMIWLRVPYPSRVIGLVPQRKAWYRQVLRTELPEEPSPAGQDYHFRYVVQPRQQAIFPPLHANREARTIWLSRLVRLDRHRQVEGHGTQKVWTVRHDAPFISYESDIFAVLDVWRPCMADGTIDRHPDQDISDIGGLVDPFLGLDRQRIQRVGLCEIQTDFELAILTIDMQNLPALRAFSFITLGPHVLNELGLLCERPNMISHWLEMPAVDLQSLDCALFDVHVRAIQCHHFFNEARPRHAVALSPCIRPLHIFTNFAKAWLWHSRRVSYNLQDVPSMSAACWDFVDYVVEDKPRESGCPLPLPICGAAGHGRDEMFELQSEISFDHKLLCATERIATLVEIGVVDLKGNAEGDADLWTKHQNHDPWSTCSMEGIEEHASKQNVNST
ncbi:hypothetical protein HIM_01802 [Hirsutella minnesotensis 3608]|nr:hypothetical protein HIM_01802 [Hirsutella minnesotensis 3608]